MRDATTQLERFRRRHPRSVVAGADLKRPALWFGFALAALAAAAAVCLHAVGALEASEGWRAGALLAPSALLAACGVRFGRRALSASRVVLAHRRAGRLCYAVSQRQCLLVDATGRSIEFDLCDVARLDLDDGGVELVLDGDHRGVAYAALFDLFDGTHPGPDARAFYAATASRLRVIRPSALERCDLEATLASVPAPAAWRDGAAP